MRQILKRAQEDVEQTRLRSQSRRGIHYATNDAGSRSSFTRNGSLPRDRCWRPVAPGKTGHQSRCQGHDNNAGVCCGVELQDVLEMRRQQVRLKQALTHLCLERCERRTTTPYAP